MDFLIILINGLGLGGIYAMIALGYTMVYGIAKMLNFAHGDIIMVGGYTILVFLSLSPALAIVFSVIFCVAVGIATEKLAYNPLRGASPLAVLITAIGVSYLLQSLAQIIFGASPRYVIISSLGSLSIGGISISYSTLITLISSALIMALLSAFVKYTKTGRAMLAVSEDRDAARLMGVNINRIIMITFALGSALAAIAGLFSLLRVPTIMPTYGALPGIKAFCAAVIGGIGSIPGAVLGGILLGVIECICNSVSSLAPFTMAVEFSLLIIILLVKPSGLLGKKRREKV